MRQSRLGGANLYGKLQSISSLLTVSILKVPQALIYLESRLEERSLVKEDSGNADIYLADQTVLHLISVSLTGAASLALTHIAPAIFTWGILAHALKSFGVIQRSEYERLISDKDGTNDTDDTLWTEALIDIIQDAADDQDIASSLMSTAVDELRMYDVLVAVIAEASFANISIGDNISQVRVRLVVLKIIRMGLSVTKYSHEVLIALLAALTGCENHCFSPPKALDLDIVMIGAFLDDTEILYPHIFQQSQMRFPYETLPFLKLCTALEAAFRERGRRIKIMRWLRNMTRFTQRLPPHYTSYELAREDELPNCIRLTQDLPMFSSRKDKRLQWMQNSSRDRTISEELVIPINTIGLIISDTKPAVTAWELNFSMLQYLTRSLSTLLNTSGLADHSTHQPMSYDAAAEAVAFFSILIETCNTEDSSQKEELVELFSEVGADIGLQSDLMSIILDLFEQELHTQRDIPAGEGSLELLTQCARLICNFITINPGRVWAFLRRSVLVDIENGVSAMTSVISSVEMLVGRYDFLRACLGIFENLVDDVIKYSVVTIIAKNKRALTRYKSALSQSDDFCGDGRDTILRSWCATFIDIFKSVPGWKFDIENERFTIETKIASIFRTILRNIYSVDDMPYLNKKILQPLALSAEFLTKSLLFGSSEALMAHPVLNILSDVHKLNDTTPLIRLRLEAILDLATILVKTEAYIGLLSSSSLSLSLLKSAACLVYIYGTVPTCHMSTLNLLHALTICTRANVEDDKTSFSLLGYLGPINVTHFMMLLSQSLLSLRTKYETQIIIWKLLASIITDRQQWFILLLLHGRIENCHRLKHGSGRISYTGRSIFMHAMNRLVDIGHSDYRLTVALMQLITSIQKNWPSVNKEIQSHPELLSSLNKHIPSLLQRHDSISDEHPTFARVHILSQITEIFAFHIRNSSTGGDMKSLHLILPNLDKIREISLAKLNYNHSLHTNLAKNFEKRFPGCSVLNLKKTAFDEEELGTSYFYDRSFAAKVLVHDSSWMGQTKSMGFYDEFTRANLNLSVVESQLMLLRSWGLLTLEISPYMRKERLLQNILIKSIIGALRTESITFDMPSLLSAKQYRGRLDHSFVLLHRIEIAKSHETSLIDITTTIWSLIRAENIDSDNMFLGENVTRYQKMLRILYLSLSKIITASTTLHHEDDTNNQLSKRAFEISKIASTLIEIFVEVVAKGFRFLANQMHTDPRTCSPADFLIVTAILQALLQLPGASFIHSQIALQISNFAILRYVTSLFSWSDELIMNGDPIYTELSIKFIIELSNIPLVAEQLAVEGVLSQICAANIMNLYRKPKGMGPFNEPYRMFRIWTDGILPLCLNLLEGVGPPIAGEVVSFLNQFSSQLSRATDNLRNITSPRDDKMVYVTLGTASEIYTLALISHAIDQSRIGAWASVVAVDEVGNLAWDKNAVKEDIENLLSGRRSLRERIIPNSDSEAAMARSPPSKADSKYSNLLEEKVFDELQSAINCLSD